MRELRAAPHWPIGRAGCAALQALLSRCVQHASPLVQQATLALMAAMLAALAPLLAAAEQLAAAPAAAGAAAAQQLSDTGAEDAGAELAPAQTGAGVPGGVRGMPGGEARAGAPAAAGSWPNFLRRLRASVRSRLPDPATLMALVAALSKAGDGGLQPQQEAGPQGAGGQGETQEAPGPGRPARPPKRKADRPGVEAADGNEAAKDGGGGGASAAGQRARAQLMQPLLLQVLTGYQRWLPEAMADAHFDACKLLPAVGAWAAAGQLPSSPSVFGLRVPEPCWGGEGGRRDWALDCGSHPAVCLTRLVTG